jgi:hypothetical protein
MKQRKALAHSAPHYGQMKDLLKNNFGLFRRAGNDEGKKSFIRLAPCAGSTQHFTAVIVAVP